MREEFQEYNDMVRSAFNAGDVDMAHLFCTTELISQWTSISSMKIVPFEKHLDKSQILLTELNKTADGNVVLSNYRMRVYYGDQFHISPTLISSMAGWFIVNEVITRSGLKFTNDEIGCDLILQMSEDSLRERVRVLQSYGPDSLNEIELSRWFQEQGEEFTP